MKRNASIVLLLYTSAVLTYSAMEIGHSVLHVLASHLHTHVHDHGHGHHHHVKDHHHHLSQSNDSHEEEAPVSLQAFYPLGYLERDQHYHFLNSFQYINRKNKDPFFDSLHRSPATPPPQPSCNQS
jgi:hypothetical protein